jgi:hypothetical protein
MRKSTKPSTAKCNLGIYTSFLLSEPKFGGCKRLAEILGNVSHDSINRFLLRELTFPVKSKIQQCKPLEPLSGNALRENAVYRRRWSLKRAPSLSLEFQK